MREDVSSTVLSCLPLFKGQEADILDELCPLFTRCHHEKKYETIYDEVSVNKYIYFVLSGAVKEVTHDIDGKISLPYIHRLGDWFGENSFSGFEPPCFKAITQLNNTCLLRICGQELIDFIATHPSMAEQYIKLSAKKSTDYLEHMRNLATHGSETRLRLILAFLFKRVRSDLVWPLQITHQDLGCFSGLPRETVSRLLVKMQRAGDIKMTSGQIAPG